MADVVVTVPIGFTFAGAPGARGLDAWCAEGDTAGEEETGQLWRFTTSGGRPVIARGERVYIVCEDRVRGYSPLVSLRCEGRLVHLIRGGGAVAVTIPEKVVGFRGWRYRWWERADEIPFPDWKTADRRHKNRQRNLF